MPIQHKRKYRLVDVCVCVRAALTRNNKFCVSKRILNANIWNRNSVCRSISAATESIHFPRRIISRWQRTVSRTRPHPFISYGWCWRRNETMVIIALDASNSSNARHRKRCENGWNKFEWIIADNTRMRRYWIPTKTELCRVPTCQSHPVNYLIHIFNGRTERIVSFCGGELTRGWMRQPFQMQCMRASIRQFPPNESANVRTPRTALELRRRKNSPSSNAKLKTNFRFIERIKYVLFVCVFVHRAIKSPRIYINTKSFDWYRWRAANKLFLTIDEPPEKMRRMCAIGLCLEIDE